MAATALYDGTIDALWYNVDPLSTNYTVVDAATGISKLWFEVDEDGRPAKTEDQGGAGFAVQDAVMVANSSCVVQSTSNAHIQITVRADKTPSRVYIEYDLFSGAAGDGAAWITVNAQPAATGQKRAGEAYQFWTAELPPSAVARSVNQRVNIAADIEGAKVSTSSFVPLDTSV